MSVFPPLNPDHEMIKLPESMMKSLNLAGSLSPGGGVTEIKGADMIYNYEGVLRQVSRMLNLTKLDSTFFTGDLHQPQAGLLPQQAVQNRVQRTEPEIHQQWIHPNGMLYRI